MRSIVRLACWKWLTNTWLSLRSRRMHYANTYPDSALNSFKSLVFTTYRAFWSILCVLLASWTWQNTWRCKMVRNAERDFVTDFHLQLFIKAHNCILSPLATFRRVTNWANCKVRWGWEYIFVSSFRKSHQSRKLQWDESENIFYRRYAYKIIYLESGRALPRSLMILLITIYSSVNHCHIIKKSK